MNADDYLQDIVRDCGYFSGVLNKVAAIDESIAFQGVGWHHQQSPMLARDLGVWRVDNRQARYLYLGEPLAAQQLASSRSLERILIEDTYT